MNFRQLLRFNKARDADVLSIGFGFFPIQFWIGGSSLICDPASGNCSTQDPDGLGSERWAQVPPLLIECPAWIERQAWVPVGCP